MSPLRHRYVVCRKDREPVAWEPPVPTAQTGTDVAYWGRVFALLDERLDDVPPLTFVLTWDLAELPVEGPDVVAVVQGDEDALVPRWSRSVRATFKCYGVGPTLGQPPARLPPSAKALELAHHARRVALFLPGAGQRAMARLRSGPLPPIHPVPLGYYNQLDLPTTPFDQRRWAVSFAGSAVAPDAPRRSVRERIGTPKNRSRSEMLLALEDLGRARPDLATTAVVQDAFPDLAPGSDEAAKAMALAYSELLMDSRISLVPRGNSLETFRYFEALRAGCVVVCEALPQHWFYRSAPVLRVRRWNELGAVLEPYLREPARLHELHERSLAWWQARCSEGAVADYLARHLQPARHTMDV